jgi:hypothetical protein
MQKRQRLTHYTGLALLLALAVLSGCTGNEVKEQGLDYGVLRNANATFQVSAWSEQDPARIGELLRLKLRSGSNSFLSLYEVSTSGRTARLFENRLVQAGEVVEFPGPKSAVDYRYAPPPGTETFIVLATARPVDWLTAEDIAGGEALTALNLAPWQLVQRLREVTGGLTPESWSSAVVPVTLRKIY